MKTIASHINQGIVNRVTGSLFSYQGWPTVARDEQGTLYAVASGFRVSHVCPFGKTVMYISKNEGKTWTPPIVINDTYMDDRDAGILYMGNGRMLVSWFTHSANAYQTRWMPSIQRRATPAAYDATMGLINGYQHLPEEEQLAGSYVRISEDYGVTWSEIIRIPVSAPHGPTLCRDGSLIYLGLEMYEANRTVPISGGKISLYRSTDHGYTWTHVSDVSSPAWLNADEWLDEPHVLELPDGRILGAFRIEGRTPFTIGTTVSEDGGKSWSEVCCTGISGSPPHLMLHSSGALICSFGRREAPFGERAMVSYNLGESWDELYVLDERSETNDLGYPSTVELDDGSLFTVYYQKLGDDPNASILYTHWKLQDRQ